MQAKLNYYSRYNRIKVDQKKSIPSLYSLLSTQTLNKLAHDASVSLQMISFYNRQNNLIMAEEEANQSEYLQASKSKFNHSLYHSLDEKAHSVSPSAKNSRDQKLSSSLVKKQKISKKKYLQNLVKEVREKSLEMVKNSEDGLKEERKKKKSQKAKKSKAILKEMIMASEQKYLQAQNEQEVQQKNTDPMLKIQNKLIKQLLGSGENKKSHKMQEKGNISKRQIKDNQNFNKEYVQSVQDQNQEHSKHSIVIERLNLTKHHIGQELKPKQQKTLSKQDNPSQKDIKESQIKSFSKQSVKRPKPSKNLIEIELTHSQSEIWKPQSRSLQNSEAGEFLEEIQAMEKEDNQKPKNQETILLRVPSRQSREENPVIQKTLSIFSKEESLQEEMKDMMCEPIEQISDSYPMSKSYKFINSETQVQFLSQLNHNKQIQQAPYEHPLQVYSSPRKTNFQTQGHFQRQEPKTDGPKKTSFKKFIMNKELNPRLVTSTILNQKNIITHHPFVRDFTKDPSLEKQKQNQEPVKGKQATERLSVKKNFKKVIMMSKKTAAKESESKEKEEKVIPLRKIENQKLLHAFFNQN